MEPLGVQPKHTAVLHAGNLARIQVSGSSFSTVDQLRQEVPERTAWKPIKLLASKYSEAGRFMFSLVASIGPAAA